MKWTCPTRKRVVVVIDGHEVTAEFRDKAIEDAAGDLLKALKRALPFLESHIAMTARSDDMSDRLAYEAALAAIEKAESKDQPKVTENEV